MVSSTSVDTSVEKKMIEKVQVKDLVEHDVVRIVSALGDSEGVPILRDGRPVLRTRDVQVWSIAENGDGTVDVEVLLSADLRARGSDVKTHTFTKLPTDEMICVTSIYKNMRG